jgi:hypothetical protein
MTSLSQHAKSSLNTLVEKHLAFVVAKATIEAELKLELVERLSSYRSERDIALRLADEAGVPRTQLGKAIGTTNYRTIQEILAATEHISQHSVNSNPASNNNWNIIPLNNGTFNLHIERMGIALVTGSAIVSYNEEDGDLEYIEGDSFVIPQVYRNGYASDIIKAIV